MFNKILKWGIISGTIMVIIFIISYLAFPLVDAAAYTNSEILGYVGILLGTIIIYFAIADYFKAPDEAIGLWPRILLGLGVAFIAGIMVGLYNVVYILYIDPNFMANYLTFTISQLPTQSGAEFDKAVAELTQQKEAFDSASIMFFLMAATVWFIGIPASIVCAFLHKRLNR